MINLKKLRLITFVLLSSLIFTYNNMQVSAAGVDTYENEISAIMEEKRAFYLQDPEFYREAYANGLSFEELLRQKVDSAYRTRMNLGMQSEISLHDVGNNGQNLSTNVPLIQQTEEYNCGPTSALQVLYGMACQDLVKGQTDKEKIDILMCESGTDKKGTYVYRLTNTLNNYTTRADYEYILGTSMTEAQFQGKVETSLFYNIAPIIHARTEYLSYYNQHQSGHYIAIREVDRTNKTIRLMDCNYNVEYFGNHVVPVNEVFQSISAVSSRYLICMSY